MNADRHAKPGRKKPVPVILDTDIGADIDDTWAVGMLLNSPELDLKMVVTDEGNTVYRAKIAARMLQRAGRSDVPVGIGLRQRDRRYRSQAAWVANYRLARYPGQVHDDGVEALCAMIMASREPLTLICIGPVPNIAEALRREPRIAARAHFVGMHGSIYRHHGRGKGAIAEANVRNDLESARLVLSAPWRSATITPLDTCGRVRLRGRRYQRVRRSTATVARVVMENYDIWAGARDRYDQTIESSILFDTVAVYLAFSRRGLKMKTMGIRVTDEGFTVPDPQGARIRVALDWVDLPGYLDLLTERMSRE